MQSLKDKDFELVQTFIDPSSSLLFNERFFCLNERVDKYLRKKPKLMKIKFITLGKYFLRD